MSNQAVSDGAIFMCACGCAYKLQVSSSSAKGDGNKLATNGNCKLVPIGPVCPNSGAPTMPPPTDSVMTEGQGTAKIDGKKALSKGCAFQCKLIPNMISAKLPGQMSVSYETSGGVSVSAIAGAAVEAASGQKANKEQSKEQPGEEDSKGDDAAKSPTGSKGNEMKNLPNQKTRNTPKTIEGRQYSGHALDQMQNRGIPRSAVENAIKTGKPTSREVAGKMTTNYYDGINNVTVVTNDKGGVITVGYGKIGRT